MSCCSYLNLKQNSIINDEFPSKRKLKRISHLDLDREDSDDVLEDVRLKFKRNRVVGAATAVKFDHISLIGELNSI